MYIINWQKTETIEITILIKIGGETTDSITNENVGE